MQQKVQLIKPDIDNCSEDILCWMCRHKVEEAMAISLAGNPLIYEVISLHPGNCENAFEKLQAAFIDKCALCKRDFTEEDMPCETKCTTGACKRVYHQDCIKKLLYDKPQCPTCSTDHPAIYTLKSRDTPAKSVPYDYLTEKCDQCHKAFSDKDVRIISRCKCEFSYHKDCFNEYMLQKKPIMNTTFGHKCATCKENSRFIDKQKSELQKILPEWCQGTEANTLPEPTTQAGSTERLLQILKTKEYNEITDLTCLFCQDDLTDKELISSNVCIVRGGEQTKCTCPKCYHTVCVKRFWSTEVTDAYGRKFRYEQKCPTCSSTPAELVIVRDTPTSDPPLTPITPELAEIQAKINQLKMNSANLLKTNYLIYLLHISAFNNDQKKRLFEYVNSIDCSDIPETFNMLTRLTEGTHRLTEGTYSPDYLGFWNNLARAMKII